MESLEEQKNAVIATENVHSDNFLPDSFFNHPPSRAPRKTLIRQLPEFQFQGKEEEKK
jgi:hypothetical protein